MKLPVNKGGKKVLQGSLGVYGEKRIQKYTENELPQRHAAFLMKSGDQHIFLRLGGGLSALPAPDGSGASRRRGGLEERIFRLCLLAGFHPFTVQPVVWRREPEP